LDSAINLDVALRPGSNIKTTTFWAHAKNRPRWRSYVKKIKWLLFFWDTIL